MHQRLARFLIRLYPRAWRARYADELADLIDQRPVRLRDVAGIAFGAFVERGRAGVKVDFEATGQLVFGFAGLLAVTGAFVTFLLWTKPQDMPLGPYAALWTTPPLVWFLWRLRQQRR